MIKFEIIKRQGNQPALPKRHSLFLEIYLPHHHPQVVISGQDACRVGLGYGVEVGWGVDFIIQPVIKKHCFIHFSQENGELFANFFNPTQNRVVFWEGEKIGELKLFPILETPTEIIYE
jgi:hypothetical protein